MTARTRALVFGASGYIGTNLVPRLVEAGWWVRAAARHRAVLEARDWQEVELIEADALDPETLPAALQDIDVAFYLVHSMAAGKNFAKLDIEAAKNFAAAAADAGLKRIVYLGGLAPADGRLSPHLRSRIEVGEVLAGGATPVTELRAAEEDADATGSADDWLAAKRRLDALEAKLPHTRRECVRGMIAHAARRTGDRRLVQAAEWIADFRKVEARFAEAERALAQARAGKRANTVSEAGYRAAHDAWMATGREHGEWKARRDAVLDPAKRALMELRAKQARR